jgi:phosphatidylinositol glycan class T
MDVTKSFLRYTEHPPDAQRGWDLPPAVILPLGQDANGSAATGRIYTPALLVDLATPDFSMPYNVIIFTCSLVAFLFGSVFNLLTRKFVIVPIDTVAEKPTDGSNDSCTSISFIMGFRPYNDDHPGF